MKARLEKKKSETVCVHVRGKVKCVWERGYVRLYARACMHVMCCCLRTWVCVHVCVLAYKLY